MQPEVILYSLFRACVSYLRDCFRAPSGQEAELTLGPSAVYSTVLSINIPLNKCHLFHEAPHGAPKLSVTSQHFAHTTTLVRVVCGKMGLSALIFPSFTLSWEGILR